MKEKQIAELIEIADYAQSNAANLAPDEIRKLAKLSYHAAKELRSLLEEQEERRLQDRISSTCTKTL